MKDAETRDRLEKYFEEEVNEYMVTIRHQQNEDKALKCVAQALQWACSLIEFYRKNNDSKLKSFIKKDAAGGVVDGIKYARNRSIHQFIQLLHITGGGEFPMILPAPFFEIRWKKLKDLPSPDKGFEQIILAKNYENSIQDVAVRFTFDKLNDFFKRVKNIDSFK